MEFRKLTIDADFAILCDHWKRKEEKPNIIPRFQFSISCSEDSTSSIGSISSSSHDALSSFSSSSLSDSTSSLLSQSEVLCEQQPPIKKGLSRFYEGKSRTFSSLSDVKCIEDLAKGGNNYRKKDFQMSLSPKAIISKKLGRSSFATFVSKADS